MKAALFLGVCGCFVVVLQTAVVEPVIERRTDAPERTSDTILVAEDCHQPKETGRCFALIHRYAFNVESGQCEPFIYGGCQGNRNNFRSKAGCEEKCIKNIIGVYESSTELESVESTTVTPLTISDAVAEKGDEKV